MSATIDERIVEMRFDNKQFEQGAKESMSTLDRLKNALNLSSSKDSLKELDNVAKTINFDSITNNVEKLADQFSLLGTVARKVKEEIADALINTVKKGVSFASNAIVQGGINRAMNIENAHFQLQALLKDEERVQAVMANANDSVSGTAYAYDEAAKAAAQFAASGVKEGEQMMTALRGIVGVAAMTNSEYEGIARIFNTVAGNGRVMGDQLLQLSSRGLNAAATLADFFNDVNSGAVTASTGVTSTIKALTKGTKVAEADIREMVSKGKISFDIFSEAMNSAFGESAFRANETFTGALSNIKAAFARIGAGFVSPLVAQNSEVVRLFNSIREQVNNVKKTLVFDDSIGNVNALSKQVTDSLLDMAGAAADFIQNADITKPMELFYYGVEIVKNSAKGLGSVLKPAGKALVEVFGFDIDNVIAAADKLEDLTYRMRLSEDASKNLHDVTKGLADVFKLLIDGAVKLVKVFIPINKPIVSASGGLLELAGAMGRGLTTMTELTRKSELLHNAYDVLTKAIASGNDSLKGYIENLKDIGGPEIAKGIERLKEFVTTFRSFEFPTEVAWLNKVRDAFVDLYDAARTMTFDQFLQALKDLKNGITDLFKNKGDAEAVGSFTDKLTEFLDQMKKAFTFDSVLDNISKFREALGEFASWIKGVIGPIFENIPLGNIISSGTSISMILSLIKVSKTFEKLGKGLTAIPSVFNALNTTLLEYQKSLKATVIVKIAASIAILAAALALLTFVDTNKLYNSALVLTIVAGLFLVGISKLIQIKQYSKPMVNTINGFSDLLSNALDSFTKSLKTKAIGNALKDFGIMVALIVGSIAVLTLLFKKDEEHVKNAIVTLGLILAAMAGIMVISGIFARMPDASKGTVKAALAVYLICSALGKVVTAMEKLFKMDLPEDYGKKLAILAGLLAGIAGLTLVLAAAGKIDESGKAFKTSSLLGVMISLVVVVEVLDKLFKMDLPDDYGKKLGILAGMFIGMIAVINAFGKATQKSKGVIKAGGTLLALSVFLVTIVGSLMVLSFIPTQKLMKGALTIGTILISLGLSLTAASKVTSKEVVKSVLAIALSTFAIVIALSALTIINPKDLLAAATSLGEVLLSIGIALNLATKNSISLQKVLMVAVMIYGVIAIAKALAELAQEPWEGISAAGFALSKVVLALGKSFRDINSVVANVKLKNIALFLLYCLSLAEIGAALYFLSKSDWKGLLAGSAALSVVIMSMGEAFKAISKSGYVNAKKVGNFLLSGVALGEVVVALKFLSDEPIDKMLAGATALSEVMLALAGTFYIIGEAGDIDGKKVANFIVAGLALGEAVIALKFLTEEPIDKMLAAATALSGVMIALSGAFYIISQSEDIDTGKILKFGLANLALYEAVGAILLLSSMPIDTMLAAATSLSLLITAMGASFYLIGKADVDLSGGAAFLLGGVALLAITQAMLPLMDYDLSKMLEACVGLGLMLIEMSAAMAICTAVGKLGGGGAAIEGMEALLIFLAGFSAVLLAFGALLDNDATKALLSGGVDVLILIGEAIGEFIGAIIGGVLEGISDAMPGIADNMNLFMDKMQGFFDKVNAIPDGTLESTATLLGIIGLFTAAEFISGIGNLIDLISFGGGIVGMATHLSEFITEMEPFLGTINKYKEGTFRSAKILAETMLIFTKDQLLDAITSWFTGDKSLSKFAEDLKEMAPALNEFADKTKDIDSDQVQGAANAIKILTDAAKNMYGTGGFIQSIFGEKSLSDFATQLNDLAPALVKFASKTKKIDEEKVKGAVAAAQLLSDLANTLPPQNGWVNKVFGTKSLTDFAFQLTRFAPSLVNFVKKTTGITSDSVSGAVNAAQLLSDLANTLPKTGALYDKIFGTKSLSEFASQLDDFGPSISSFADDVKNVSQDSVNGAVAAAEVLLSLSEKLPDTGALGGFFDWLNGKQDLGDFGDKLAGFGYGFKTFHTSIKDIDTDHMNAVIASIESMIGITKEADGLDSKGLTNFGAALGKMAQAGIDDWIAAFSDGEVTITESLVNCFKNAVTALGLYVNLQTTKDAVYIIIEKMIGYFLNEIILYYDDISNSAKDAADQWMQGYKDQTNLTVAAVDHVLQKVVAALQKRYPDFYNKGKISLERYINGMKSKTNDSVKTITDMITKIMDEFDKKKPKWVKAGEDAAKGFIEGIKKKYADAARAGEELAQLTIDAVTLVMDIQSPSKVMYGLGSYIGEGYINGITDWFSSATQTGNKLGHSTTDALKIALNEVAMMFDNEEIYDPIIKPLVDMSNVTHSVDDIAAMFNRSLEITRATAGDISMSMAQKRQIEEMDAQNAEGRIGGTNYTFTQNNYSPKALNRIDIYRNTRNQFAQFKEATGNA